MVDIETLGTGCGTYSKCEQEMERLYLENKNEPLKTFLNTSSYEFIDISSEEFRTYEFIKTRRKTHAFRLGI